MGQLKYYIIFSLFFLSIGGMKVKGQGEILLNINDIDSLSESFSLLDQRKTFWPQSFDSLNRNSIRQKLSNSKKESIFIDYCIFDSYQDAFNAISFASNFNSMPFIFGSPVGKIIGDASWVSIDGSSVLFQKDNIGVRIFKIGELYKHELLVLNDLATKILDKIEQKSSNINLNKKITEQSNLNTQALPLNEYLEINEVNTLWVSSSGNLISGHRKDWTKGNSVVSIDLISLSDSIEARKISQIRSKAFNCSSFKLDDDQSLADALSSWQKKWEKVNKMTNFSTIAYSSNKSIHFYFYDDDVVDISAIRMILNKIVNDN